MLFHVVSKGDIDRNIDLSGDRCATLRHAAPRCATLRHATPRCAMATFLAELAEASGRFDDMRGHVKCLVRQRLRGDEDAATHFYGLNMST